MRKLPIPFSDPMVAAIREGRKTQTRRILDPQPSPRGDVPDTATWAPDNGFKKDGRAGQVWSLHSPYFSESRLLHATCRVPYAVGDLLYVRETYYQFGFWVPVPEALTKGGKQKWAFEPESDEIRFEMPEGCRLGRHHKDPHTSAWHKRLGRFMPRAASRITLRVAGVKVERLQDIGEADAIAEGIEPNASLSVWRCYLPEPKSQDYWLSPLESFRTLWASINGADSWSENPWIAAYTFEPIFENIDKVTT